MGNPTSSLPVNNFKLNGQSFVIETEYDRKDLTKQLLVFNVSLRSLEEGRPFALVFALTFGKNAPNNEIGNYILNNEGAKYVAKNKNLPNFTIPETFKADKNLAAELDSKYLDSLTTLNKEFKRTRSSFLEYTPKEIKTFVSRVVQEQWTNLLGLPLPPAAQLEGGSVNAPRPV